MAERLGPGTVPWPLLALNYWTPLYVLAGAGLLVLAGLGAGATVAAGLAWLYLLPPLLGRLLLGVFGRPWGCFSAQSRGYRLWWALTQLQALFNRFPALEEALRCVPGLYGLWLGLWGARVSPFAYWSPGVVVMDRYALEIGRGAVLGGGARIGAHVVHREADGALTLVVAPVAVEAGAMVGLHAAVGPGSRVRAGESVPAGKLVRPFATWEGGRQHRHPEEGVLTSRTHSAASASPPATSST